MECNKDEAARAKEIAERKFLAKDIKGAKKFALKAQTLYPELDGISRMVTTIDVYISAEEKINGEGNWYGVLGVNPLADDETIRKRYRKLALILHPDKNKSLGAEGAFKIVSEAWSFLSDKYKRLAYDRSSGVTQLENLAKQNGFYKFAKTAASQMRVSKETEQPNRSATPSPGMFGFKVNGSSNGKASQQWTPFSKTSSVASAVRAAEMVERVYERVRKDRQKAQAAARRRKNHSSRTRLEGEAGHSVKRRKGVEYCGTSKYKMDQVN